MWRDAWIETKKREYIKEIQTWLRIGTLTEDSLRQHIKDADRWIDNKAFLSHEEISKNLDVSNEIQDIINEWLDTTDENIRQRKILELRTLLESNYVINSDLSSLEKSLLRLEKAKIEWELETIKTKLNILDIGRIEYGYGYRDRSFVVDVLSKVESSSLPKRLKWFIQHPNTAAVSSALLTRLGIWLVAWWAALWFAWWLLIPIAVWSVVWWVLAAGRAKREIKDRNAQIDRRSAIWMKTWTQETDWKSSDKIKNPEEYQHSTMDLYNKLSKWLNNNDKKIREEALESWIYYLVKHKVGREQWLNMLQYDSDKSVSSQHVEMIMLFNKVFPWFVAKFNSWEFFDEKDETPEAQLVREKYNFIKNLSNSAMSDRDKLEKEYAIKQWVIYAWVALTVWGTLSYIWNEIAHSIWYWQNPWQTIDKVWADKIITNQLPDTTTINYPDNLQEFSSVKRSFWYDNSTSSFDKTELNIHTDKSWWWNVTNMLWKLPFTNGYNLVTITWNDFTSWNIQAVITPKVWWPSFILPIDSNWNIQIPPSMQDSFNNRDFAFLEVWKVQLDWNTINLNPIATVKWSWNMIFDKITTIIPWGTTTTTIPWEVVKEIIPWSDNWYWVPFWWNKYHHINNSKNKESVGDFIDLEEEQKTWWVNLTKWVDLTKREEQKTWWVNLTKWVDLTKREEVNLYSKKINNDLFEFLDISKIPWIEFSQNFWTWVQRKYKIVNILWEYKVFVENSTDKKFVLSTEWNGIPRWRKRKDYDARIQNEIKALNNWKELDSYYLWEKASEKPTEYNNNKSIEETNFDDIDSILNLLTYNGSDINRTKEYNNWIALKYAQELQNLVKQYWKEKLNELVLSIRTRYDKYSSKLDIRQSIYWPQDVWIIWDIAKQSYLNKNTNLSDTKKYNLWNPFENSKVVDDIVYRHIGWESLQKEKIPSHVLTQYWKNLVLDWLSTAN